MPMGSQALGQGQTLCNMYTITFTSFVSLVACHLKYHQRRMMANVMRMEKKRRLSVLHVSRGFWGAVVGSGWNYLGTNVSFTQLPHQYYICTIGF